VLRAIPPTDCDRAREAASARADGELSELEAVQLDSHLRGCPACAAQAAALEGLATRIRGAELEQPALPVFVPRRRRPVRVRTAAVAAALVAAALSSFAAGHLVGSHASRPAATVGGLTSVSERQSEVLGMLRRLRLGRMSANRVIPV
jgi:predicted anti-sigma-YlaC factor YlaD